MKFVLSMVILVLLISSGFSEYRPYNGIEEPQDRPGGCIEACPNCLEDTLYKKYVNGKLVWKRCDSCNYSQEYKNILNKED